MSKKFIMAALAGFLTVCGVSASAQEEIPYLTAKDAMRIIAVAKPEYKLGDKLTAAKSEVEGNTLGYIVNPGTASEKFVTLGQAAESVTDGLNGDEIAALGHFSKGDKIQFGYKNSDGFTAAKINVVSSDSGYFTGYNPEGFYQLDFSAMPFDGQIDILVIGEPLPSSTVTLLVALGFLALFMGYQYRRQRAHAVQRT